MKSTRILSVLLLAISLLSSCKHEKKQATEKYKLTQSLAYWTKYDEGYPLTDKLINENAPYETPEFKSSYTDFYKDKTKPQPFDFNVDLSHKSFNELRLLRAEILARHGFLFMDYVLRSYFNGKPWYQPVFWYNDFKIKLTEQEEAFISKVLARERELYKQNYIVADGYKKANPENVINWVQFSNIPAQMMSHLKKDGFVINKGDYEQLFHVYDENYYDYTPGFITTDLFLQVMHMHVSKEMQALEEDKMIPLLTDLLTEQMNVARKTAASSKKPTIKNIASWNQTYYAMALSLLSGQKQAVPAQYAEDFDNDYDKAYSGSDKISSLLNDSLLDFTQFQPRANYTRTDSLKRYFRCMKWLNNGYVFIDTDEGLSRAILLANGILQSSKSLKKYNAMSAIINFLAGDENNLSMVHLMKILPAYNGRTADELTSAATLAKIRKELYAANPRQFAPKPADEETKRFMARKKMLFTAGRYTFDGEIMQRLVHVTLPQPKRKYPKALDVFAAMGNKTAENILLNVYKEKQLWPNYVDTLALLKRKFSTFSAWDKSVYNKTMQTILTLQQPTPQAPYFMQMPNWQKKNLNTMLGAWTGLKHDMLLYIEQPSCAEMGDGGEVPPPQKIAYLEPQLACWKKCVELLQLNRKLLTENDLLTEKLERRNKKLIDMANFFIKISQKELKGVKITNPEFDRLAQIGGEIESLTLDILESNEAVTASVSTPDRYMAIAADVYTYNEVRGGNCLEECVGMADEIYVIAEINGLLYLTRGAVFSHYEFLQPISDRLTDESWQKLLLSHKQPKQAVWMNDIKINIPKLKTAPNFNLY